MEEIKLLELLLGVCTKLYVFFLNCSDTCLSKLWQWPFIRWLTSELNVSRLFQLLFVMAPPCSSGDFGKHCHLWAPLWRCVDVCFGGDKLNMTLKNTLRHAVCQNNILFLQLRRCVTLYLLFIHLNLKTKMVCFGHHLQYLHPAMRHQSKLYPPKSSYFASICSTNCG